MIIPVVGIILFSISATSSTSLPFENTKVDLRKVDISVIRYIINDSLKETDYLSKSQYSPMIIEKSKKYGIPVHLALALINAESQFNPNAKNRNTDGSIDSGLMQLNSNTFDEYSQKQLMNPDTNTTLGLIYLRDMYDRLGTWEKAVMAYNAGPYRVEHGKAPDRTVAYMYKIMQEERDLNSQFLGL